MHKKKSIVLVLEPVVDKKKKAQSRKTNSPILKKKEITEYPFTSFEKRNINGRKKGNSTFERKRKVYFSLKLREGKEKFDKVHIFLWKWTEKFWMHLSSFETKKNIGIVFLNIELQKKERKKKKEWFAPIPWTHISSAFFCKQQNVWKPSLQQNYFQDNIRGALEIW